MITLFRNLYRCRELLISLILREYTSFFKQSLLGPAWAVIQPIMLTLMFTLIRSFVHLPSDNHPYALFAFAALMPWTLLSSAINSASGSIVANAGIVKKIYFPREVFPTAAVFTRLLDFSACFVVFLALMAWYRVWPGFTVLLMPFLLAIQLMLALGIGLLTSALGAFRRDILVGLPILMQFWMYASPVMYPLSSVPEKYRALYLLNPMAGLIDSYRKVLIDNQLPSLAPLLISIVGAFLALNIGYTVFRRLEMQFADVV